MARLARLCPGVEEEQKPINPELSANEDEVAMLDFSGDIGVFILPDEFCAKEVDEQQDDRARNLENTEEMLEGHKGTNQDIIQVNKSPCFSNTSDKKIQSANNEGRLHFATPRKSYAKDNRFDKRNRSRWSSRQKSSAWVGGSSIRKQIWVLKSRGQDMGLAAHDLQADALVGVQMA
uniref:Uncharacterized protein n=1 Tax=Oryza sativa subsp. japonica TaxID=39947 RepID=Q33BH3_ORYSJ|nr:hypothetical protein LOC_Os10g01840 [Oryza sativa Japonica Group]